MSAKRITIVNVQRDFVHGPPTRVTLRDSDGLIADVPVTVFSAGLVSRGLPDFGQFAYERAINEPNDMAGTSLLERVIQDECSSVETSVVLTLIDRDSYIADIPATVSSVSGTLTARGLPDFGRHQLEKVQQYVCVEDKRFTC